MAAAVTVGGANFAGLSYKNIASAQQEFGHTISDYRNTLVVGGGFTQVNGNGHTWVRGNGVTWVDGTGSTRVFGTGGTVVDGSGETRVNGNGVTQVNGAGGTSVSGNGPTVVAGYGETRVNGNGVTQVDGAGTTWVRGTSTTLVSGNGPTRVGGTGPTWVDGNGMLTVTGDAPITANGANVVNAGEFSTVFSTSSNNFIHNGSGGGTIDCGNIEFSGFTEDRSTRDVTVKGANSLTVAPGVPVRGQNGTAFTMGATREETLNSIFDTIPEPNLSEQNTTTLTDRLSTIVRDFNLNGESLFVFLRKYVLRSG